MKSRDVLFLMTLPLTTIFPMKRFLLLFLFVVPAGCGEQSPQPIRDTVSIDDVVLTKKDDSTACAYWMCSKTKKLYMQKYVKGTSGKYRPAGAYKLDEGVGAFPLKDLDKYGSDGEVVSTSDGFDPCPYCGNTVIVNCDSRECRGKTYCETSGATEGTCPRCGDRARYRMGSGWGVGSGG